MKLLNNKIIIITGGAGLLGSGFVKAIVEKGGVAVMADIDKKRLQQAINDLKIKFYIEDVDFFHLDITSKNSIIAIIDYLDKKYGKIDALVNNAYPRNKNYGRHFFNVEYEDFCENIAMHLGGYFLMSQQLAKYFKKQNYGNIINIASIQGIGAPKFDTYEGTNMTSPVEYSAVKAAIINLTKYMAKYFKGSNIRVNSISAGGILNNQPEKFCEKYKKYCLNKGMLDKEDICGTLIFLLSDMSQYINGQNIIVDDGWSL